MTAYNAEGYLADLPSLATGRYSHGCGHFVNTADREVGRGRSLNITGKLSETPLKLSKNT